MRRESVITLTEKRLTKGIEYHEEQLTLAQEKWDEILEERVNVYPEDDYKTLYEDRFQRLREHINYHKGALMVYKLLLMEVKNGSI